MMRRRRRSRSTWSFADGNQMVQPSGTANGVFAWILPPGRVNYLCDTDRVDSLVFKGCHLWMDFYWSNQNNADEGLPDVTMYIIASQQDAAGDPVEINLNPWSQPSTPSTIASWENAETDGTDSFLWCHHIKGISPPNALVNTNGADAAGGGRAAASNQYIELGAGASDHPAFLCRKFYVTQEFQPDVVVRTKRRLRKDQGIVLFMRNDTAANVDTHIDERHRVLVGRGR